MTTQIKSIQTITKMLDKACQKMWDIYNNEFHHAGTVGDIIVRIVYVDRTMPVHVVDFERTYSWRSCQFRLDCEFDLDKSLDQIAAACEELQARDLDILAILPQFFPLRLLDHIMHARASGRLWKFEHNFHLQEDVRRADSPVFADLREGLQFYAERICFMEMSKHRGHLLTIDFYPLAFNISLLLRDFSDLKFTQPSPLTSRLVLFFYQGRDDVGKLIQEVLDHPELQVIKLRRILSDTVKLYSRR